MRSALVANREDIDPGFVGRALRVRGYSFTEFLREDFENWPSLEGYDLVLSLGSNWSVYWPDVSGPVKAEQALLAKAMEKSIPVLGVCFGAQQISAALGGQITKAQSPEIGWHHVFELNESTIELPAFFTRGAWMQWHYDSFSAPTGARVLADSPAGPQIMVCGTALAIQFHPEATESIVRMWSSGSGAEELVAAKISRDDLLTETAMLVDDAEARCDELVGWFLTEIAQKHMA